MRNSFLLGKIVKISTANLHSKVYKSHKGYKEHKDQEMLPRDILQ